MAAAGHGAREGVGIGVREVSLAAGHPLLKACWIAGGLGILALAAAFALGGLAPRFWASYWTAWLWGATVAVGGLFFVLLHHVTRAGWSVAVRRLAEHVAGTLPVLALLAVPALLAAGELFPWMGGHGADELGAAAHDPLLEHKAPYLNAGFFYFRSAVYLGAWSLLGWWFRRTSIRQDTTGDPRLTRRLQTFSAPGLVVFGLTLTFAAFDWVMSLDPHWFSTIFGVYLFAGSTVAILSLLILLGIAFERRGPLAGVVTPEHYHDLGKLLFGFVVFWAYIGFSQYMLIWYGNIPEETVWYAHRLEHGWEPVTWALALGHFVLPFFYLLSRAVKRRRPLIAAAAVWLLLMHYLDLYWLVMPAVAADGAFAPHWLDLVTLVAMAGIVLGVFGWLARRPALVPVADPRLPESLSFENM
ncbi:MAG TPA: hypothetical protein VLF66_00310 [Thermoanaerobaculia bacterium]|nr:hypothetical protein [Thermoanaerobaculia bacterium]